MITDLTDTFVQALSRASVWQADDVSEELQRIIQQDGGKFEWSKAAGEEWMALDAAQGRLYALVWTHAPLAILQPSVSATLRTWLAARQALIIEEADWHRVAYSIQPDLIQAQGLPDFWPLGPDDPTEHAMSLLDLYTVTNN